MKRMIAALVAVVILASVGTGVLVWWLSSNDDSPKYPEISAYSHGHLVRVGPYRYCEVLNPTKCEVFEDQGELPVTESDAVQLSVPPAIARAPWVLLRQYEDSDVVEEFRPGTRLAVTIPTVDPRRGKLTGLAVLLPTLVRIDDEEVPAPHAEWSVRTVWS
ncbi:DUF2771 domain-containing protein [Mycobacterium neumannii]|uniref:DUF2771 domain-containing protein n=1 Tax=Mycobacterium neumannii TaxID=2048551 RepID=UPI0007467E97|nr:hypothetical protein AU189_19685 [Mycolicibacterium acapulense]KUI04671.1 hypothetical protein AU190_03620 [Mycolicibacterium acapulense]KUI13263.1 hypothetical protein AU191_04870 [Mycolicibacterium acapulense]